MTSVSLARSYIEKAVKRLKVLDLLMQEKAYSDADEDRIRLLQGTYPKA